MTRAMGTRRGRRGTRFSEGRERGRGRRWVLVPGLLGVILGYEGFSVTG